MGDRARFAGVSVKRVSTVEAVTTALRDQILLGSLPGGTALREAELCDAFDVSRHTLRSAMQSLIHDGFLEQKPNHSVSVRQFTAEDVIDLYRLRTVLELEAATTVAQLSAEHLDGVRLAVANLKAIPPDAPWTVVRDVDLAFHQSLIDAIDSPRMTRVFASILGELHLCFRQLQQELEDHDVIVKQHSDVLDALERRDGRGAAKLLRTHLDTACADIVRVNQEDTQAKGTSGERGMQAELHGNGQKKTRSAVRAQ